MWAYLFSLWVFEGAFSLNEKPAAILHAALLSMAEERTNVPIADMLGPMSHVVIDFRVTHFSMSTNTYVLFLPCCSTRAERSEAYTAAGNLSDFGAWKRRSPGPAQSYALDIFVSACFSYCIKHCKFTLMMYLRLWNLWCQSLLDKIGDFWHDWRKNTKNRFTVHHIYPLLI